MSNSKLVIDEYSSNLKEKINGLLSYTDLFDCMIGYFYVTGFSKYVYNLNATDKIRILIGTGLKDEYQILQNNQFKQISSKQIKHNLKENIKEEFKNCENSYQIEEGVKEFITWLEEDKIEIRVYNKRILSPKMYILSLDNGQGRVITGSTNITNTKEEDFELNVELTSHEDYTRSLDKFNSLWGNAIDVKEEYLDTIKNYTWINDDITPYELYLKFLYEYFLEQIDSDQIDFDESSHPANFKMLEYQKHAVIQARDIISQHGGVFLSDVVGLGKTYMGALLLRQLKGKSIIIAPPTLVDKANPGGWEQVLKDFDLNYYCQSRGKLEDILDNFDKSEYNNVLIDESHYFRNENTQRYELLHKICEDKNVILISATPYNNAPSDILAQIKLFQNSHDSTIPNVRDIEHYFNLIRRRLDKFDKHEDKDAYEAENKQVTKEIREDILKHLMVRRTRHDIDKYYKKDLQKHSLEFPVVNEPILKYYSFDKSLSKKYDKTLKIITDELTYAKYTPLSTKYLIHPEDTHDDVSMGGFIKTLLFKRLESSLYAFNKSIDNCIKTHKQAINTLKDKNEYYISRNYNKNIYQLIENEDIKEIEDNINKGKIRKIHIEEFSNQFLKDLISDYESFKKIKQLWQDIDDYPKEKLLIKLINKELRNKKIIIFTEFVDTANYLYKTIKENCTDKVLMFTGKSSRRQQQKVIDNFDANKKKNKQHNEYNILISTDVLSHGVNLHRSNIIINYDIPWNPTKIMQRIGRVQRLGTEFDDINIYNFFPVDEIENTINLKQQAQNKINAFIQLLGTDAKYLTNEQVKTHDLFKKINEEMYDDEGENELQYLMQIREIRDEKPELYDKIKSIPPKIKISRKSDKYELITLFKSDNLKSIIKTSKSSVEEIDFFTAIRYLNAEVDEVGLKTNIDYYELLDKAYDEFTKLILKKTIVRPTRNELKLQEYIKYALQDRSISANEQIDLLDALNVIKQGKLTKKEVSTIKGNIEDNNITTQNIIKEVEKIDVTKNNQNKYTYANKEIILSEYFRDD